MGQNNKVMETEIILEKYWNFSTAYHKSCTRSSDNYICRPTALIWLWEAFGLCFIIRFLWEPWCMPTCCVISCLYRQHVVPVDVNHWRVSLQIYDYPHSGRWVWGSVCLSVRVTQKNIAPVDLIFFYKRRNIPRVGPPLKCSGSGWTR